MQPVEKEKRERVKEKLKNSYGKSFKDLVLWRKAHELVLGVYKITSKLPDSERFGLISQIQRSSVSVPANTVEGYGRISSKEKLRFLYIANGSLEETRYFLILIQDLNFSLTESLQEQLSEVSKILNSYIKKLKGSIE